MVPTTEISRSPPDGLAPYRGGRARVSPGGALTVLAAVLTAGLAARDAAVSAMTSSYPALAAQLAPANATAIVNLFDLEIASGGWQKNPSGWLAATKQALRSDPLNARGLRLLAYVTEVSPGGQNHAQRIMRMSEQASRRDLLAQLWLIEDAVRREDVLSALQHYDRALSVHPALAGYLLPILASAASEPEIRSALVPYLRANRPWAAPFLSTAIARAADPVVVAQLFRQYGGARAVPSHAEYEGRLVQRFVREGKISEASSFALSAGATVGNFGFGFSHASADYRFRPLTWTLYDGGDGDVSLGDNNMVSISVRPETKIVAASRIVDARPGEQIFAQRIAFPDPTVAPLVTWKAYCRRPNGPERFWTRDFPVAQAPTRVEAPISVPQGCGGVQIDLETTGGEGSKPFKVAIDQISLSAR